MSALLLKALDNSKRSNASFLSNGPCLLSRRRLLAECRDHHCNNCNSQGGFGHVCDANSQKCSSVMALCYNFTRVLNILGFERFVACLERALALPRHALITALNCLQLVPEASWLLIMSPLPDRRAQPVLVA